MVRRPAWQGEGETIEVREVGIGEADLKPLQTAGVRRELQ